MKRLLTRWKINKQVPTRLGYRVDQVSLVSVSCVHKPTPYYMNY